MKDEGLDRIAASGLNVARFVSAAPSGDMRFARLVPEVAPPRNFADGVRQLFALGSASVNVRCFRPDSDKGNPFEYGVSSAEAAIEVARRHMAAGFFVIVNETVRVDDGGVSGVSEGGVWEFAPDATPRVVETGDVCRLPAPLARRLLEIAYSAVPDFLDDGASRIEFSIHPEPVGYMSTRTLIWEVGEASQGQLEGPTVWPNPFSRHVGDKAFGLLVAHLLGLPVPTTMVIARRLPPFTFGVDTGSRASWTRTAPGVPHPGRFSTVRGWPDVFSLLAKEDPQGEHIASVLYQQAIQGKHSGAAIPGGDQGDDYVIEGVAGDGDRFMLGEQGPIPLPAPVLRDVRDLLNEASAALGAVRLEWVHDGQRAWVVQMHRQTDHVALGVFFPGEPDNGWLDFRPEDGLQKLPELLDRASKYGFGIRISGNVGVTSHVGDLIRRARIPSVVAWGP